MTPINIAVPESLTKQKRELEATLTTILAEEERLVAKKKEIQAALAVIATSVAILSGELVPTAARKPMSDEAKSRIADGLKKSRDAKAAQLAVSAPPAAAPAPAGRIPGIGLRCLLPICEIPASGSGQNRLRS